MQIFGLIGYPLSHSFSPSYFNQKFLAEKIDADYQLFPIESIEKFPAIVTSTKLLRGLNVTIPYKEAVLPFLDEVSAVAKTIGAVNTIVIKEGKLIGHNTDAFGFEKMISNIVMTDCKALVFGTGGASKAVQYVLHQHKIPFTLVSRNPKMGAVSYADLDVDLAEKSTLWINCTPVGMHPNIDEVLPLPFSALTTRHTVIDLVYNPNITLLMAMAEKHGAKSENGLQMLHYQAQKAWELWQS